jgi:hypothetical protein
VADRRTGLMEDNLENLILRNSNVKWVDRFLNPQNYPKPESKDGVMETHRMSVDGNGPYYVYPQVTVQGDGYVKQSLEDAISSKDYIMVDDKDTAIALSKNYKSLMIGKRFRDLYDLK